VSIDRELELDGIRGITLGSWYHCLPISESDSEGDCTAVVCKVVCCMELRLGL